MNLHQTAYPVSQAGSPEAMALETLQRLEEASALMFRSLREKAVQPARDAGATEYDSWAGALEYDSWSATFR